MRREFFLFFVALASFVSVPAGASEVHSSCKVQVVGTFENRVHALCSTPDRATSIYYCAVPASAREMASRVEAIGLVAQVTGATVYVYFNVADTSGTSFGCSASDCRTITGLEIHGVGPLVSAPVGSMAGSVAMLTLPEPAPGLEVAASSLALGTVAVRKRRARIRHDAARSS